MEKKIRESPWRAEFTAVYKLFWGSPGLSAVCGAEELQPLGTSCLSFGLSQLCVFLSEANLSVKEIAGNNS